MQSTYYVRRQHDGAIMSKVQGEKTDFLDMDNAIFFANKCVISSNNTTSYEIVRTKDNIIVAIVNEDHSVGETGD